MFKHNSTKNPEWLLFFYNVPSKPVSKRMKIWRKLLKSGSLQLKGSVYLLPLSDEHYEFCQWLVSEVIGMGGEGVFAKVKNIETMNDNDLITLFNRQRESEYRVLEKDIENLERKIKSMEKGSETHNKQKISDLHIKLSREFEEIKKRDFFASKAGNYIEKRLETIAKELESISRPSSKKKMAIEMQNVKDYQNKVWVTRKKPFVDRMASAWLIKKFIDKNASFKFIDEQKDIDKHNITFDIGDGDFTHHGDLCTFEVLLKAFCIKDKTLKKIAGIVHVLDMKDEKYNVPEAQGIEEILSGIRKTACSDSEMLEKGMAVFEMLYASKQ